jgi:hypothetical protein
MPAILTTLNARTADPVIKPVAFIDQSGVGAGPFVPVTSDMQSAAFAGAVAMSAGQNYQPQRSVGVLASVAGNLTFTFPDSSALTLPVGVGWQTYPFQCTQFNFPGSNAATATVYNLV